MTMALMHQLTAVDGGRSASRADVGRLGTMGGGI